MVLATVRYTGGNILVVDHCPYCGRTHQHGASLNVKEYKKVDNIKDYKERIEFLKKNPGTLGSRMSHCGNGKGGEYTLIFSDI